MDRTDKYKTCVVCGYWPLGEVHNTCVHVECKNKRIEELEYKLKYAIQFIDIFTVITGKDLVKLRELLQK